VLFTGIVGRYTPSNEHSPILAGKKEKHRAPARQKKKGKERERERKREGKRKKEDERGEIVGQTSSNRGEKI